MQKYMYIPVQGSRVFPEIRQYEAIIYKSLSRSHGKLLRTYKLDGWLVRTCNVLIYKLGRSYMFVGKLIRTCNKNLLDDTWTYNNL